MKYEVKNQNLFSVPQGYYLAHCISADFALGAGIAKQFDENYNMREKLKCFFPNDTGNKYDKRHIGNALIIDNVFNLVTKGRFFYKPTYGALRSCLEDMKRYCDDLKIKKIAMPLIGCGLDRLSWDIVEPLIKDVFNDTDIDILVCIN